MVSEPELVIPDGILKIISIGIIGQQGAGKDTLSKMIECIWPEALHLRIALADAIKDDLKNQGFDANRRTPEARGRLQIYGAKMRLNHGPDYWIRRAERTSFQLLNTNEIPQTGIIVFHHPDIRLPLEAEWVKTEKYSAPNEQGFLIRIFASQEIRRQRITQRNPGEELAFVDDATETIQEEIRADFEIENNGNVLELTARLLSILAQIENH